MVVIIYAIVSGFLFLSVTEAFYNRRLCLPGVEVPPNRVDTVSQVQQLRSQFKKVNISIDAYLIPHEDQHMSEPSYHDKRLQYISGFSGTNGYAWVLGDRGRNAQALWTDGRYYLQADQQMDCNWTLMEFNMPSADWLFEILPDDAVIGIDPKLVPIGRNWTDKVQDVRLKLKEKKANMIFLSALDEIAWLFNLRGFDREISPLFYSYAMVMENETRLYLVNVTKLLTPGIRQHLNTGENGACAEDTVKYCVSVHEYDKAIIDLQNFQNDSSVMKIWISPSSNYAIYGAAGNKRYMKNSPIQLMKSIKNTVERRRYYECQVRDSAKLVEFVAMLEQKVINGEKITELSASDMLREIRKQDPYFYMVSFNSISAVGANAAVIHYRPTPETDTVITMKDVYLLDSGGNYLDGTTDVTRTFHFGSPTSEEIDAYTRVLIGCIEVATAVWPEGIKGYQLDSFARMKLWQNGWNYNHGTGHGIGYFLNVHEGPANIGSSTSRTHLREGMFLSDEPGFYEEGKFGIRLETIVGVEVINTPHRFNDINYLGFHAATLVPFEPKLINYDMLNSKQRKWLNKYNKRCRDETGKRLQEEGKTHAFQWLDSRTKHIPDIPRWENQYPVAASPTAYINKLLLYCILLKLVFSL